MVRMFVGGRTPLTVGMLPHLVPCWEKAGMESPDTFPLLPSSDYTVYLCIWPQFYTRPHTTPEPNNNMAATWTNSRRCTRTWRGRTPQWDSGCGRRPSPPIPWRERPPPGLRSRPPASTAAGRVNNSFFFLTQQLSVKIFNPTQNSWHGLSFSKIVRNWHAHCALFNLVMNECLYWLFSFYI